jgi:hypothetical protein
LYFSGALGKELRISQSGGNPPRTEMKSAKLGQRPGQDARRESLRLKMLDVWQFPAIAECPE